MDADTLINKDWKQLFSLFDLAPRESHVGMSDSIIVYCDTQRFKHWNTECLVLKYVSVAEPK
jgi:hypothetical protein